MAEALALWLLCPRWFGYLVDAHVQVVHHVRICALRGDLLKFGAAAALRPAWCAAIFELQIKLLVPCLAAHWFWQGIIHSELFKLGKNPNQPEKAFS